MSPQPKILGVNTLSGIVSRSAIIFVLVFAITSAISIYLKPALGIPANDNGSYQEIITIACIWSIVYMGNKLWDRFRHQ